MFSIFKKKVILPVVAVKETKKIITEDIFDYYIENDKKVSYPLYIDSRIIMVNNQINSLKKGIIVSFKTITLAKNIVPIVKYDGDDNEYMCLATLLPFEENMYNLLQELNSRNDLSAYNYISPSWIQSHKGEIFKQTKDSLYKEVKKL